MKNVSTTITQKGGNHIFSTSTVNLNVHGRKLMLCIWWDHLIWVAQIKRNSCWCLLPNTFDKIEPVLLHDNSRPRVAAPVKTSLEILNWEVFLHQYFTSQCPFWLSLPSMTHDLSKQHFISYNIKNWIQWWIDKIE